MNASSTKPFSDYYNSHLQHLKLKGLRPKTIDAYSRAVRRLGDRFGGQVDNLSEQQFADHFTALVESHAWSTVKLDLYGLKFFHQHVLHQPWAFPDLVKPPKGQRLPDIVTVQEARQLFLATRVLSYRVFFFTLYSMGLRLGEGLRLQVGDIDGARSRVHVRNAKGNRDRLVPLPVATYQTLRRYWSLHRNPVLLFPSRLHGRMGAASATVPMDKGTIQGTLAKVVQSCGLKKRSPLTVFATAMPLTSSRPASI